MRPGEEAAGSSLPRWSLLLGGLLVAVLLSGSDLRPSGHGSEPKSRPFLFVSWADTKLGREVLSGLSDQVARLHPAFTIFPGDLENWGFTPEGMKLWKEAMDGKLGGNPAANGMSEIVFAVRGNHDRRNTSGWRTYFDFQATAGRVGATHYCDMPGEEELSYSFDYRNAHFIGVDVPGDAPAITSDQIRWIDTDLTAAEARGLSHAFLFFHGPIYCVGPHCSCGRRVCPIEPSLQDLIVILNRHRIVTATFHGHEHTRAHTYIDESRIPPDGSFEGVTHPFHQFVSGTAGAKPMSCDAERFDYCAPGPGFAAVSVDGPKVTVSFYRWASMDPVDTIRFTHQGAAGP